MNIKDILQELKNPVDQKYISSKKIKGNSIDFISWYHYCEILDQRLVDNLWSWEITSLITDSQRIYITGKLTIHGDDRSLSQMATGTEELSCSSYGDPSSNAEAMALRRACAKFGLARYLWDKKNHIDSGYSSSFSQASSNKGDSNPHTNSPPNNDYKPWLNLDKSPDIIEGIDKYYVQGLSGEEIVKKLRNKFKVSKKTAQSIIDGEYALDT